MLEVRKDVLVIWGEDGVEIRLPMIWGFEGSSLLGFANGF